MTTSGEAIVNDGDDFENFTIERSESVATITLSRVAKHNSLTSKFWSELRAALTLLEGDGVTRAVILTGKGDRAFSAGGDIAGFANLKDIEAKRQFQEDAMAAFHAIETSSLAVIAAVNGFAFGGGCELAIASDVVIASADAQFGMPEARIGLVPGYGVTRAAATIGVHWSKWLVLTGEPIDAITAERIGLVQKVVPAASLTGEALRIAQLIANNAPLAVRAGKALIKASAMRTPTTDSVQQLTDLHASEDTAEGIQAFIAKRAPRFAGA